MKHIFFLVIILALLAACSPAATPQPTVDAEATLRTISDAIVAGTLTAQPTATLTDTPVPTPTETFTPIPPTLTLEPTATETATSVPFVGTLVSSNVDNLPQGLILVVNNTGEQLTVTIQGVTSPGEKTIYAAYLVNKQDSFYIPFGSYSYVIMVGNKKTFTGNFRINNKDKTTIRVEMSKVVILGP